MSIGSVRITIKQKSVIKSLVVNEDFPNISNLIEKALEKDYTQCACGTFAPKEKYEGRCYICEQRRLGNAIDIYF